MVLFRLASLRSISPVGPFVRYKVWRSGVGWNLSLSIRLVLEAHDHADLYGK